MSVSNEPKETPASKVSIIDVAQRAGVSAATVSRSLRGLPKVSAETRQRVLDAARELSYVPGGSARGGSPGRHLIAIIVPYINRWFFSTVTAGATEVLRAHGHDVLLYELGTAEVRDHFFERMPFDRLVDGILSLAMPLTPAHTLALRALGTPLASVGIPVPGWPSVGIDEVDAARKAVNHLIHLRHERIGFLADASADPAFHFVPSSARRRGYEQALHDAGLEMSDDLVAWGGSGLEGGAAAMSELLSRPVLPTAVFAEYDELAIGAMWTLRRAGLRVPGDISVVGIDGHEMAKTLDLTTVEQNVRKQGEIAAMLLLELLSRGEPAAGEGEPVTVPTRLVLRSTTAPSADPTLKAPGWSS